MRMPEFTAEASLNPALGQYQANGVFGSSGTFRVLPMQALTSAPRLTPNLIGVGRQAHCNTPGPSGEPRCTYFTVPVWYQCDVIFTPYSCMVCRPGGVLSQ
jgi:hypothetical protein